LKDTGFTSEQLEEKRKELSEKVQRGETLSSEELSFIQGVNFEPLETGSPVKKVGKRPYTLSDRALSQRRKNAQTIKDEGLATGPKTEDGKAHSSQNARKHGLYAQTFLDSPFFRQCTSTCHQYPCELVNNESTSPGLQCMDRKHFLDCFGAIHKAIQDGDMYDMNEIAGVTLAKIQTLINELIEHIGHQGIMLRSKDVKDGKTIFRLDVHPGIDQLTKLLKVIGINYTEFMVTPRALDTAKTNRNLAKSLASRTSESAARLQAARSFPREKED